MTAVDLSYLIMRSLIADHAVTNVTVQPITSPCVVRTTIEARDGDVLQLVIQHG